MKFIFNVTCDNKKARDLFVTAIVSAVDMRGVTVVGDLIKKKASRKQLTTASMQARKASTQTLRSCQNCGRNKCLSFAHGLCIPHDYIYWQPRKASA